MVVVTCDDYGSCPSSHIQDWVGSFFFWFGLGQTGIFWWRATEFGYFLNIFLGSVDKYSSSLLVEPLKTRGQPDFGSSQTYARPSLTHITSGILHVMHDNNKTTTGGSSSQGNLDVLNAQICKTDRYLTRSLG